MTTLKTDPEIRLADYRLRGHSTDNETSISTVQYVPQLSHASSRNKHYPLKKFGHIYPTEGVLVQKGLRYATDEVASSMPRPVLSHLKHEESDLSGTQTVLLCEHDLKSE